ncbi:MAG: phosphodiester glycosidase family protein [Labilithrix sp.]|nr:phosphodiester glycosidase family protein [Labilithrix sp.]
MRAQVLLTLVAMLALSACKRTKGDADQARPPSLAGGAPASTEDAGADAGDAIVEDARTYAVRAWTFPLDRVDLRIEDVALSTALEATLERTGAELVVNGGFFDPAGKAVGLAISDGAVLSRLSREMSGGVLTYDGERARLWETETFAMPEHVRFAIQCKPRLVVDGAVNIKRDDGKRSERTALCLRDGGTTIDVVVVRDQSGDIGGPSLYALASFLSRRGCEAALNLDGGPSTGAAWREEAGRTRSLPPRKGVRHAVTFKTR